MPQLPTRAHVFRSGLIFGAILGAAYVLSAIVQWLTGMYSGVNPASGGDISSNVAIGLFIRGIVSMILGIVFFLAMLALTFFAGMLTARKTGKVGSGALAGLVAGAVGGLIGGAANFILVASYIQASANSGATQDQTQGMLIGVAIGSLVENLLVDGGFGAGMGALGGLLGASEYRQANTPAYQTPFYPGAPWRYPMPPYAPSPYAAPHYPAPSYPSQAGYPTTPAQPQEPQPPQQG